jgi:hypothetical protein
MATWAGALVKTGGGGDFAAIAVKHRIAIAERVGPWLLVQADAGLHPPRLAEDLSRDLQSTVIAFFVQSAASVEQIEHWENGRLLRKLEYSGDGGGWITQDGAPQAWEAAYFFAEDRGTGEGQEWPHNLGDELGEEDIARYERAKKQGDATSIMDLVSGGSAWPLHRLCAHFGVDPDRPGARVTAPPTRWRPRLIVLAILAFLVGMFLLGALSK